MNRTPYILKTDEIDTLLNGMITHGEEETYDKMRDKALFAMGKTKDIDELFMDMHEGMLKRARKYDDTEEAKAVFYALSAMLRRIAHEVNRKYIRDGKEDSSPRFLRLVADNTKD